MFLEELDKGVRQLQPIHIHRRSSLHPHRPVPRWIAAEGAARLDSFDRGSVRRCRLPASSFAIFHDSPDPIYYYADPHTCTDDCLSIRAVVDLQHSYYPPVAITVRVVDRSFSPRFSFGYN